LSAKKITLTQLNKELRDGKTVTEIAKQFGMSKGRVSQLRKMLKHSVIQTAVLEESHEIVSGCLDLRAQLSRVNAVMSVELDRAEQAVVEAKTESDKRLWQEVMIKLCSELRKQLSSQLEIFSAWNDWTVYAQFQKDVIDTFGEIDNEAKERLTKRLQERRLLRGFARFPE